MAEYIEREAVIAEFKRLTLGENSLIERIFADGVYAVLETFPAADVVERKRGEWREECVPGFNRVFTTVFACSECEKRYRVPNMNFCPNCGAKMDGERRADNE